MRLKNIEHSRWDEGDIDLAALRLTNNSNQNSEVLGNARHEWMTTTLNQTPIEKIEIYKKNNEEYMRGFKIFYRNGQEQVINSITGIEAETIRFEQNDELVGMTCISTSESDKRPRQLGFTLLRNGQIIETAPNGCAISHFSQSWPVVNSLQGRSDIANMKVTKIFYSRWGSSDFDLAGLKVMNSQGSDSGLLGMERNDWESITLNQAPIQQIKIFKKPGSQAYMRGF